MGILSHVLRDYTSARFPIQTRLSASLLTGMFMPEEVSPHPDERLFILAAFEGAGFVASNPNEPLPVRLLFASILQEYRDWDPEGVERVTERGQERALDHLRNLLRD